MHYLVDSIVNPWKYAKKEIRVFCWVKFADGYIKISITSVIHANWWWWNSGMYREYNNHMYVIIHFGKHKEAATELNLRTYVWKNTTIILSSSFLCKNLNLHFLWQVLHFSTFVCFVPAPAVFFQVGQDQHFKVLWHWCILDGFPHLSRWYISSTLLLIFWKHNIQSNS